MFVARSFVRATAIVCLVDMTSNRLKCISQVLTIILETLGVLIRLRLCFSAGTTFLLFIGCTYAYPR